MNVHPGVERSLEHLAGGLVADLAPVGAELPRAEPDHSDRLADAPEHPLFHAISFLSASPEHMRASARGLAAPSAGRRC